MKRKSLLVLFTLIAYSTVLADTINWWNAFRKGVISNIRQSSFTEIPFDYDFEMDNLRYTIISKDNRTVSVRAKYYSTYRTENGWGYIGEVSDSTIKGNLIIPSHVTYNDTVYTVTSIGEMAFAMNPFIESVTIPSSITSIGKMAFALNFAQSYLIMSDSIRQIGSDALYSYVADEEKLGIYRHCYVYFTTPPDVAIFMSPDGTSKCDGLLHIPVGCKDAYQQAEGWKQYGENIVDDINLEGIHHAQVKAQDSDAPVYDLQGRRVENPKQGEIYIQKGKKYINK